MGDAAILLTIVGMLKRLVPASDITALVSHPEYTRKRCPDIGVDVLGWPWPVPKGKASLAEKVFWPVIFINNIFSALVYRLFKRKVFVFNKASAGPLTRLFESQVVISPGGDFISPKYVFMTVFGELLMGRILGKKLVICAQSIGPFQGLLNSRLAGFFLNLADLIIVREYNSAGRLDKIGVKAHMTADLVFAFPPPAKGKRGKRVVMCLKDIIHGRKEYAEWMSKLALRIRDMGYEVIFLPTDQHDVRLQAETAAGLEGKVQRIPVVLPPDQIASILSESEFIISSRMHAIILGILSNTPFFAVADGFKFRAVLDSLCEDRAIDYRKLDDAGIKRITESVKQSKELGRTVASRYPLLKQRAEENAAVLGEKFREWNR